MSSNIRTVIRAVPGSKRILRRLDRARHQRWIVRSGIFDPDWYRQQTSEVLETFDSELAHYLDFGRRRGLTPSPLFAPSWYEPQTWRTSRVDPLVRYLVSGPGQHGVHPIFDEARWLREHPDAVSHPGRGLGHFLAVSTDATALPTPSDAPTMTRGEFTAIVTAASEKWTADNRVARPRRRPQPNRWAQQRFVARWQDTTPPRSGTDGPLVSVVMPVRNRSTQVLISIASVQAQTLTDWEMLVVDDGSTDATAEAVELVAAADRRIRVIRIPWSGVSAARNAGIAAAGGRYVAFLDSDNTWTPDFLRMMTAAMDGSDTQAAYATVEIVDGNRRSYLAHEGGIDDLAYGNHVDLNTLVVERSLLLEMGGFDRDLRRMVDYDLVVRLARRTHLPLFDFVGAVYDAGKDIGPRITTTESPRWDEFVKNRLFIDWDAVRADLPARVRGRVSVLLPTSAPVVLTLRAVTHLLRHADGEDVEIIVLDNGGDRSTWLQLSAVLEHRPGVRLCHSARNLGPVFGANKAFAESRGDIVVLAAPELVVDGPWIDPLRAAMQDPAVGAAQPLVLDDRGLVHSAGMSALSAGETTEAVIAPLLVGFPADDARRVRNTPRVGAAGPLVAVRAADLAAGSGLDPLLSPDQALADLVWRTSSDQQRHTVVVDATPARALGDARAPRSIAAPPSAFPIDDHVRRVLASRPNLPPIAGAPDPWRAAGFEVVIESDVSETADRQDSDSVDPAPDGTNGVAVPGTSQARVCRLQVRESDPPMRWAIKTAAPAGPQGDIWGDIHFAKALADALERLGQQVVIDRREAVTRPSAKLDDVVIVLRGLDRVEPQPDAVNLLWVISHPDLVTPAELAEYDHVFAASTTWSVDTSRRTGVAVEPLLQATDPDLFHPGHIKSGTGPRILFVGNTRGRMRPIVQQAIAAQLPLTIYGGGWESFVKPSVVAGTFVPNDQLGRLYRSAGVVLNDHWEDMARNGFLSNRLFDAVAAGARVISDAVPGLVDVFGPEVQVADGTQELARLAGQLRNGGLTVPGDPFPDEQELLEASSRIRSEHSFEARARQLVRVATHMAGERSGNVGLGSHRWSGAMPPAIPSSMMLAITDAGSSFR